MEVSAATSCSLGPARRGLKMVYWVLSWRKWRNVTGSHLVGLNDIQDEKKPEQVVPCNVISDWVFKKCQSTFKVENAAEIDEVFSQYFA